MNKHLRDLKLFSIETKGVLDYQVIPSFYWVN